MIINYWHLLKTLFSYSYTRTSMLYTNQIILWKENLKNIFFLFFSQLSLMQWHYKRQLFNLLSLMAHFVFFSHNIISLYKWKYLADFIFWKEKKVIIFRGPWHQNVWTILIVKCSCSIKTVSALHVVKDVVEHTAACIVIGKRWRPNVLHLFLALLGVEDALTINIASKYTVQTQIFMQFENVIFYNTAGYIVPWNKSY